MKGVSVAEAQGAFKIVDDLEKPEPGPDQILVKSLFTAINPVDGFMQGTGLLVLSWPWVIGCDAAGVVVKAGGKASATFKEGDEVCGCTRLGSPGYSTCQEYFLMDAPLTIPKPKNITIEQAATLGVGTETACLGLLNGLHIDLPDPKALPEAKDEWVVVLGGASSVGKYAIQILKACGYKVIASCSAKSAAGVKKTGADAIIDYKKSLEDQLKDLMTATGSKFHRIFDAAASGDSLAKLAFKELTTDTKYFSTTNDWNGIGDFEGGKSYIIALGPIGRDGADELNADLARYIPVIGQLVEDGKIKPNDYDLVGEGGMEAILEAISYQQKGAGGSNKVIVKVQDK